MVPTFEIIFCTFFRVSDDASPISKILQWDPLKRATLSIRKKMYRGAYKDGPEIHV